LACRHAVLTLSLGVSCAQPEKPTGAAP
jgi:hypothetical protein